VTLFNGHVYEPQALIVLLLFVIGVMVKLRVAVLQPVTFV
jgi:hypothetical protein